MPFLEVRNLHHAYALKNGDTVHALKGIDFTVESGEYIAVLGANGSGKTTLALHLNGILQPGDGTVTVDRWSTADPAAVREVRRRVGMVFQSPDDQLVATVVEEDVAFGPENLGVAEDRLAAVVRDALKQVGMWEHRLRPPHQLSAGQKQRVAIAGALAMNPRCLVLDEATSMLDPAGAREVIGIVEELHHAGMTVLTVTHKMQEAARADRVIVLSRGELVADGPPSRIFEHPDLARWNLRPPPVTILATRLRSHFPGLPAGLSDAAALASSLVTMGQS